MCPHHDGEPCEWSNWLGLLYIAACCIFCGVRGQEWVINITESGLGNIAWLVRCALRSLLVRGKINGNAGVDRRDGWVAG